jgi:TRAP-type C4-dicarboxylate transport system permease small subunit
MREKKSFRELMGDKNSIFYKMINQFEIYIGTICFVVMTVLLFVQVITRYVFRFAIVWTEELSIVLFVWMLYCGISAAVLDRKQIRVDALIDAVPFKWKKFLLILSNITCMIFCAAIFQPLMVLIKNISSSRMRTMLLRIPQRYVYIVIPAAMLLMIIRCVQECVILYQEDESRLGQKKSAIDFDTIEREIAAQLESAGGNEK